MFVRNGIDISAPADVVWRVYSDVERWPEWTESVNRVTFVSGGPQLGLGSEVKISQPKLPTVTWVVTDIVPGLAWTWTARSPGAETTASHMLTVVDASTTRVDQTINQRGPIGGLVGRLIVGLTRRYLAMEAEGLKYACESEVRRATD